MKIKNLLFGITALASLGMTAQVSITGEFRPRTEYRNGFGNLKTSSQEVGFGTSLRSRLNVGYKGEGFSTYISLQDVTVFGENRQLKTEDANNSFAIFEAWANIELGKNYTTKIGRQMISYDDQRIMGAVGWAQQARTHDAFLIKHKSDALTFDIGLAYNQDYSHPTGFVSTGNTYNTTGFFSYKTMQYLWANKKWDNFSASALILNNGFQKITGGQGDGTYDLTTYGTHIKTNIAGVGLTINAYGQSGKNPGGAKIKSAYLASIDGTLKISDVVTLGAGFETISGNDLTSTNNSAFFPIFGTNHKFNGFMDYFYVGNHAYSQGLNDIHISSVFKLNKKTTLLAKALNFSTSENLASGETKLGTEIDLVLTYKLKPAVTFQVGYSQMFESAGMKELKGINVPQDNQNWAWAQITIKPKFL